MATRLDDMRTAADQAAQQMLAALGAFQLAAVYFAIAVSQTSDVDYLIGRGQALPIVSSSVPTRVFLAIGPALTLILHVALLLQWALWRHRTAAFLRSLEHEARFESERQLSLLFPLALVFYVIPNAQPRRMRWPAAIMAWLGLA